MSKRFIKCGECGGNSSLVGGRSAVYEWNRRQSATTEALAVMEQARHVATDLLQHLVWLTNGLPAMLEEGGLTDEEGLIGAAIDAATSARPALATLTEQIERMRNGQG